MKRSDSRRFLVNVASPYGLALISFGFFLVSCLMPPAVYGFFMHEPDLMFLDPVILLYYSLCVAGFFAGVWLFNWLIAAGAHAIPARDRRPSSPALFLLTPLLLCLVCTVYSIYLILKTNPLALLALMTQSGNLISPGGDASLELHGTMNISVLFVAGIVWWSYWRSHQFVAEWRGRFLVKAVQILAVLAVLAFTFLVLSKHLVTVLITGLVLCYLIRKNLVGELSWRLVGRTLLLFAAAGSTVFFFVSFLKGASDPRAQIASFFGYTIASYNRLAALLHGQLHFEYPRRGIYFSSFLSFDNLFNRFIPFRKTLNLPDYLNWWMSEFDSVGRAGLNPRLIFVGTFGELFLELGWFAPLYLVFYGALYALVWRWLISGRLAGIILYPYLGYCILFWFSTNGLLDQDIVALVIDAMLLAVYEWVLQGDITLPRTLARRLTASN